MSLGDLFGNVIGFQRVEATVGFNHNLLRNVALEDEDFRETRFVAIHDPRAWDEDASLRAHNAHIIFEFQLHACRDLGDDSVWELERGNGVFIHAGRTDVPRALAMSLTMEAQ